ncbi:nuclease [Mycolicibacterium moriokaense]|nr:nuclease [Mycolicibacterium moriokaense]
MSAEGSLIRAIVLATVTAIAGRRVSTRCRDAVWLGALVAVVFWAAAALLSPSVRADDTIVTATVLKAVDGDTIDIRDDIRGRLRVRVLGIDTPETSKPGYTVGCWGPEATEFARSTLVGQRVSVEIDPTQDRTDRYGRTLAYLVRADGWDYSVEAARAGAAHSYVYDGRPVARFDQIAAAQNEARDAGRGLWGPPCYGDTASVPTSATQVDAPAPLFGPAAPPPSSSYFANCAQARAAGTAPLIAGAPGYRSKLDGDGDGVACEN